MATRHSVWLESKFVCSLNSGQNRNPQTYLSDKHHHRIHWSFSFNICDLTFVLDCGIRPVELIPPLRPPTHPLTQYLLLLLQLIWFGKLLSFWSDLFLFSRCLAPVDISSYLLCFCNYLVWFGGYVGFPKPAFFCQNHLGNSKFGVCCCREQKLITNITVQDVYSSELKSLTVRSKGQCTKQTHRSIGEYLRSTKTNTNYV